MIELREWESFYVIVGASAGALIGLQFVVMTLVAAKPSKRVAEGSAAFATPTVVHFGAVLLVSALVCAPWSAPTTPAVLFGLAGLGGAGYSFVVVRRMKRQQAYRPQLEDWAFHAWLPALAYVVLLGSAVAAPSHLHEALFGVGATAVLLLFVGIHNAWDAATYQIISSVEDGKS